MCEVVGKWRIGKVGGEVGEVRCGGGSGKFRFGGRSVRLGCG